MTSLLSTEMVVQSSQTGTTPTSVIMPSMGVPTRILAYENSEKARNLITRAAVLKEDVQENHVQALNMEWNVLTTHRVRSNALDLLGLLADQGFAWRDIARMIGVSVPAVQKWRRGEKIMGENRFKLARLVAAQDLIASQNHIQDIESWFETPIPGAPITPIDMWAAKKTFLVLEYASGHLSSEEALTQFDPDWRSTYDSPFETFLGEDGFRSIRAKD
jgi:hypothetical protein